MHWGQLRAILWLRWRLTRNQLTRGMGMGAVIAVLAAAVLILLAVGAAVGGVLIGALALEAAPVDAVMFTWDGVTVFTLFFALIGVLVEIQRSESVDLTRLLHLPIALRQVFYFNYLASLLALGTIAPLAFMLGLTAGLVVSRGPFFLLAPFLVLTFTFMLTAWIYGLRGWLVSLMVSPRRRRAIIMWITIGIIVLGQSPQLINLAVQRRARREREAQRAENQTRKPNDNRPKPSHPPAPAPHADYLALITEAHSWVPVLWLPNGVRGLAAGEVLPALWGGAGMFALGWVGLRRAYRTTVRFYRGDERNRLAAATPRTPAPARQKPARNWVERRLPWVPDDVAALALAQFRALSRAPEVRMMLGLGLFLSIFLPAVFLGSGGGSRPIPEAAKPFAGTVIVVMVMFSMLQLICNQFGCDRDGFRSLVLLPTPRERLLLGKNLAILPLAVLVALVPFAAASVFLKLTVWMVLAALLQFASAFLLFCAVGNLSSILAPFRLASGSLKPTKQSWQTMLFMLVLHMLFPLAAAPMFLPPLLGLGAQRFTGLPPGPVMLVVALALVAGFSLLYRATLRPLGQLMQRRETRILQAVTEVTE